MTVIAILGRVRAGFRFLGAPGPILG